MWRSRIDRSLCLASVRADGVDVVSFPVLFFEVAPRVRGDFPHNAMIYSGVTSCALVPTFLKTRTKRETYFFLEQGTDREPFKIKI